MKKAINSITDLLPNYFKIVGVVFITLSILSSFIAKAYFTLSVLQKELYKNCAMSVLILGLFFVAWAKSKIEDEMSIQIRLQSASNSFSFGVFYVIIRAITEKMFFEGEKLSGQELIMAMLVVHLITTFIQKRKQK